MPVHDWSRVNAGIFHDFHNAWITELRNALNDGLLPPDYYALGEQVAGATIPDVLTLQAIDARDGENLGPGVPAGATALVESPPRARVVATTDLDRYARKQRTLVIRHATDDRIIALIEILSPGNKASRNALRSSDEKAAEALNRGYHLLLIDLIPPTPRDPQGIHGAIWSDIESDDYEAPADQPLTLAAYSEGPPVTAYVEPIAVGDSLREMPLFLDPEYYVSVPLEATYRAAWRGVPRRWRDVLEPPTSS